MKEKLSEIIIKSATCSLELQLPDGSMPAGHNGLYRDEETNVRNTGHWLITYIYSYRNTKNKDFRNAAQRAKQYLLDEKARPMKATFWHRKKPEKDFCNGLVGQAWTIEALVEAYGFFNDMSLINLCKEVFLLHPFNRAIGLWKRVNVDGSHNDFDTTFNHQLWFALSGAMLSGFDEEIKRRVTVFLDKINTNLTLYNNGLIFHGINSLKKNRGVKGRLKQILLKYDKSDKLYNKAIGYHSFNMYAFALLKGHFPDHVFWDSEKFKKAIHFMLSDELREKLNENPYGYPYNVSGIEMAFALQHFHPQRKDLIDYYLSNQFKDHFNLSSNMMDMNNEDPFTISARIYEATRIKDLELKT